MNASSTFTEGSAAFKCFSALWMGPVLQYSMGPMHASVGEPVMARGNSCATNSLPAFLAVFALVDDVYAHFGLLAHHVRNGLTQLFIVLRRVRRRPLAVACRLQQFLGPHDAAHVGGENAVDAALHWIPKKDEEVRHFI
jgi:hypothetical protein